MLRLGACVFTGSTALPVSQWRLSALLSDFKQVDRSRCLSINASLRMKGDSDFCAEEFSTGILPVLHFLIC